MKKFTTLIAALLFTGSKFVTADEGEPTYRIIENLSMEAPITNKEFENWETTGAAVMTKNNIILCPEITDKKGAIYAKSQAPNKEKWIVDIRVKVGNDEETFKGGTGLGFWYLRDLNKEDLNQGLMGYSKRFDGLGVFLNSVFSTNEGGVGMNYMQAFTNDGSQNTNFLKISGEKNCKVAFRNLPGKKDFHFRVEYNRPQVSVFWYNKDMEQFESCVSFDHDMDFNGMFLLTASAGIKNPDHYFIDSLALYNPEERVSEGHNQHYHDAHKKKAIHDMAQFEHDHIV